jgi:hypothetical protein
MRFKVVLMQVATIAVVALLGLAVLRASVGRDAGRRTTTPTLTAEELSAQLDRVYADDRAALNVAIELIRNGRSVAGLPHTYPNTNTTAHPGRPLDLDVAIQLASALVAGEVVNQFLALCSIPLVNVPVTCIVSVLRADDGQLGRVSQAAFVSLSHDGPALVGRGLLEAGRSYAVLGQPGLIADAPYIIDGRAYDLLPDGSITRGALVEEGAGTLAELRALFQRAKTAPVVATSTRTVEETSALSDRIHAEQLQAEEAAAEEIIRSGRSVRDMQHADLAVTWGPAPDLNAAVHQASEVVVGTVEDQFLARCVSPVTKDPSTCLVSRLRSETGELRWAAQGAFISLSGDGPRLAGRDLLEAGKLYAALVEPGSLAAADVPFVIPARAYDLLPDGSLTRGGNAETGVATLTDLRELVERAKTEAVVP